MRIFLFDIDGTLVSTGGAGKAALEEALVVEFAIREPHDVPLSGRTDRGIASNLFILHGIEDSEENWQRFKRAYLRRLPELLPKRKGSILPGVVELLGLLKSRGDTAVGLLTGNVPDGARLKLEHYGIYEHFAFGGFGDRHGQRNDVAREALAAAHRHLAGSIEPDSVWVLGDTPFDVHCARAIGARVVAVATGVYSSAELHTAQPDLLVEDLRDTNALAERFFT